VISGMPLLLLSPFFFSFPPFFSPPKEIRKDDQIVTRSPSPLFFSSFSFSFFRNKSNTKRREGWLTHSSPVLIRASFFPPFFSLLGRKFLASYIAAAACVFPPSFSVLPPCFRSCLLLFLFSSFFHFLREEGSVAIDFDSVFGPFQFFSSSTSLFLSFFRASMRCPLYSLSPLPFPFFSLFLKPKSAKQNGPSSY